LPRRRFAVNVYDTDIAMEKGEKYSTPTHKKNKEIARKREEESKREGE